jgi:selenium donor protein
MTTASRLDGLPPIRLTALTECGGCAAKLGADLLADALSGLGAGTEHDPALIAGLEHPDDAAAYRVSDDLAILGTLDFFPPLVDDPVAYGEIAAANALSDVFAMGGRVLFALSIAAFPDDFPKPALAAVFEAAASKVREAGGTLAGGHTIRDPEPKYGLAVIGAAHPDRLFRKGGARPGDVLLLTKRLGTGLLVSGRRQGRTTDADLDAAIAQMRTLNRAASEGLVRHGIRGATDVTGSRTIRRLRGACWSRCRHRWSTPSKATLPLRACRPGGLDRSSPVMVSPFADPRLTRRPRIQSGASRPGDRERCPMLSRRCRDAMRRQPRRCPELDATLGSAAALCRSARVREAPGPGCVTG